MGKIKIWFIVSWILLFGSAFGFFLAQNRQDIMIDLLYRQELVEISVGRFALSFFVAGLLTAFVLTVGIIIIQNLELRAARKESRVMTAQLAKLRELSFKDAA